MDNMAMPEEIEFDVEDLMNHRIVKDSIKDHLKDKNSRDASMGPLVEIA
jgi:hypothetical protein